jgi:hypothetical protein
MNTSAAPAAQETPGQAFAYEGPDALYAPIQRALREVVDPEVAMSIVVFATTMAGAAWAWRVRHPVPKTPPHADPAPH